jgi:hypothetical protein
VENVSADLPGVVERNGSLYLYGQPGMFLQFITSADKSLLSSCAQMTPAAASTNGDHQHLRKETDQDWTMGKCQWRFAVLHQFNFRLLVWLREY